MAAVLFLKEFSLNLFFKKNKHFKFPFYVYGSFTYMFVMNHLYAMTQKVREGVGSQELELQMVE